MARMSHTIRDRFGTIYFRRPLPDALAGQVLPPWPWPAHLAELVSPRDPRRLKGELRVSLRTKDAREAKRAAARWIARSEDLFRDAARVLAKGPPTPSDADIQAMTARHHARRLAEDDAARDYAGADPVGRGGEEGEASPSPAPALPERTPRERERDRREGYHRVHGEHLEEEAAFFRTASARRDLSPVQPAAHALLRASGHGHLPADHPLRADLAKALLSAEVRAHDDMARRHAGDDVPTPRLDAHPAGTAAGANRDGPTLGAALEAWREGKGARGGRPPRPMSIKEAENAVRRFKDMHGDLRVGAITRRQAREFRDAVAKLPARLPAALRALPLPAILAKLPAKDGPGGTLDPATVNKLLNLLSTVTGHAAGEADLADRPGGGWTNPFKGLGFKAPAKGIGDEGRQPFGCADLRAIFTHPEVTGPKRPAAAKGEATKWLPLLGLFTGARLDELGQLRVRDVSPPGEDGSPAFLRFTAAGEGQHLKTASSRREVPIHPELSRCGLLTFHAERLRAAGPAAPLLPGFDKPDARGVWTAAWSKWFGRFLRERAGIADRGKVFHSFRHTFKDACRDAGLGPELHDRLTGHAGRTVGEGYGRGPSLATLADGLAKVAYPGLDLSHLHAAGPPEGTAAGDEGEG